STSTWTMPWWSRRSMKHSPPRLRATSAQPHKVTLWPIRASSTSPQKWVRMGVAGLESPLVYRPAPPPVGATPCGSRYSGDAFPVNLKSSPPWRLLHVLLGGGRLGRFRLRSLRLRRFRLGRLRLGAL